jgi:hypothetical protein
VDRPSAGALVFTARRLRAEPMAILFGARDGEVSRFEAAGLPELALTGLSRQSADAVLATSTRTIVPGVRDRLLAEAGGNPLALLELPAGLSAQQLQGLAPLPDVMPLTPRLESVFRQRIGHLPGAAQTALLIAAADHAGEVPAVMRAAAGLRLAADALDPAQHVGLIQVTGSTITFRHPLVRSAVYQAATLSQRQVAHAALAGALSGEENTDRRARSSILCRLAGLARIGSPVVRACGTPAAIAPLIQASRSMSWCTTGWPLTAVMVAATSPKVMACGPVRA